MIRVFTGEDTQKAHRAARDAYDTAIRENPEAFPRYFDDISFDVAVASETFSAESLFGGANIFFFDGILDHPDGEVFYRTIFKETAHTVIVREVSPPKELLEFFRRIGEIKEFHEIKKVKKEENSFAIADAIGRRDKKQAWVEFERIRRSGGAMEEVHGTIFWAFKSMYLCATLPRELALGTGMKEYTYRNYQQFAKKYLSTELSHKLGDIKEMYHRAHRGEGELDVLIERFILAL